MTQNLTTLDVRPDFRSGQHPCDKIQGAIRRVSANESLRLLVPFEPVPIYEVARGRGLTYQSKHIGGGEWEVILSVATEANPAPTPRSTVGHSCSCPSDDVNAGEALDVDARGLEPPQPMVRILEALNAFPDDAVLRARTDRRPVHLLPILEQRGFTGQSEEQADGSFITHIRRS